MHSIFRTAPNIDCVLKLSHGDVESSLLNNIASVLRCFRLDYSGIYFSLAYIQPLRLLTLLSAILLVFVCLF